MNISEPIKDFYLNSADFNGIPLPELARRCNSDETSLVDDLSNGIRAQEIGVLFGVDGNPHIQLTGFRETKDQIVRLSENFQTSCAYPRAPLLARVVDDAMFADEPYKRELALGEPQLAFRSFDLSVLEFYRNDPRYEYVANDMSGRICILDEFYQTGDVSESDEVLIETFGFSYDDKMNRAVAVFLRYLRHLSPEHQQIWRAKELSASFKLHPEYFDSSYYGKWQTHVSIHDAFLAELHIVNQMSEAMGHERLFRIDYGKYLEDKPPKFSFLLRPTASEFNSYVLLLDKLLSDNIDIKFFGDDIERESEVARNDGKIEVQRKGTISLLDEWVRKHAKFSNPEPWDNGIAAIKKVRKLRQKPAHSVDQDRFDQKFFKDQRDLIVDAYSALRNIRLLFANHPGVRAASIEIPEPLSEGDILSY